jgi:hypothetical protein
VAGHQASGVWGCVGRSGGVGQGGRACEKEECSEAARRETTEQHRTRRRKIQSRARAGSKENVRRRQGACGDNAETRGKGGWKGEEGGRLGSVQKKKGGLPRYINFLFVVYFALCERNKFICPSGDFAPRAPSLVRGSMRGSVSSARVQRSVHAEVHQHTQVPLTIPPPPRPARPRARTTHHYSGILNAKGVRRTQKCV